MIFCAVVDKKDVIATFVRMQAEMNSILLPIFCHCGVGRFVCCCGQSSLFVSAESRESSRSTAVPKTEVAGTRHAVSVTAPNTSAALSQLSTSDANSQSVVWSSSAAAIAAANAKRQSMTSSRREELLQQLKAVEDAIAKKRSKMH